MLNCKNTYSKYYSFALLKEMVMIGFVGAAAEIDSSDIPFTLFCMAVYVVAFACNELYEKVKIANAHSAHNG